jgi:hypothetical protein
VLSFASSLPKVIAALLTSDDYLGLTLLPSNLVTIKYPAHDTMLQLT